MSPDVNTSWAPHPSCELGWGLNGSPTRGPKGPRRRDVERTRASRWRRGSRGMRPGKRPGHTHTRTSTHTHTDPAEKGTGRSSRRPERRTQRNQGSRTPAGMRQGVRSSRATRGRRCLSPSSPDRRSKPTPDPPTLLASLLGTPPTIWVSFPPVKGAALGVWSRSPQPTRQTQQDRGRAKRKTLTARAAAGSPGAAPSKGAPIPPHAGGHDRTRSPALAP